MYLELLQSWGARPVIYGDEASWLRLDTAHRPYFQKRGTSDEAIDWRVEKEWRIAGDVDLSKVAAEKAVVFVPSQAEAEQIAQLSRWPVLVCGYGR